MFTILIVDDNHTNRQLLKELLGCEDYRLFEAADGVEALKLMYSESPDLVISDIVMPVMDGFEFVRQVRNLPALSATPVIFYTAGYSQEEAHALAEATGVRKILCKPANVEVILQAVQEALHNPQATISSAAQMIDEQFGDEHRRRLTDKLAAQVTALEMEITERKKAEAERTQLLHVLEASLNEIYIFHADTLQFQYINHGAQQNLGYMLEQLHAMTPLDLEPEFTEPKFRELIRPLLKREQSQLVYESLHRRADGSFYPVEVRLQLVDYKETQVFLAMVLDITERRQAEAASARLAAIVESSNDAILSKTLDGIITTWNSGAHKLFGYTASEAIGRPITMLVPSDRTDEIPHLMTKIREGKSVRNHETIRVRKDGSCINVSISISPLRDPEGHIIGASSIKRDITERKRAETLLHEREQFLHALLENFPNGSVNVFDRDLRYVLAAGRGLEQMGLTSEQLVGKTLDEAFAPGKGIVATPYYHRVLNGETVEFELSYGKQFYAINAAPLHNEAGEVFNVLAVAQDISERKRAEEALAFSSQQLRALARRLESVQEEQRANIARELHDELGQMLSALRINLSLLGKEYQPPDSAPSGPPIGERIESLLAIVDSALLSVRRICLQLRPRILDDLGLAAAIEWQVGEFQKHAGMRCRLVSTLENLELDRQSSTTVFRLLQEALTNVLRHACASRVEVDLYKDGRNLVLEVRDNGRGITVDDMAKMTSLGLLGMRERALLLGGTVSIHGKVDEGTLVQVRIPLVPVEHPDSDEEAQ